LLAVGLVSCGQPNARPGASAASATVAQQVTHVPPPILDAVGPGTGPNMVRVIDGPALSGPTGKPQVLYIGAEFCPFCASERWSLIIALSRFGEFADLTPIRSAGNDVYPNTASLSFDRSRYESAYVDFVPVETETRDHVPLRMPSQEQQELFARYDRENIIPFVDVANRQAVVGSGFGPSVLQGRGWEEIARALEDPTDPITLAVVGHANRLTAAICEATGGEPSTVCTSTAVTASKAG
jgi:hypothetical protein